MATQPPSKSARSRPTTAPRPASSEFRYPSHERLFWELGQRLAALRTLLAVVMARHAGSTSQPEAVLHQFGSEALASIRRLQAMGAEIEAAIEEARRLLV